jgi:ABC-2 type transport system permease protein
MSSKLFTVIQREYLQQVRSKGFWIATALIPALGLLLIVVQVAMAKTMVSKGKIAIVDLTGRIYEPLLAEQRARGDDEEEEAGKKTNPEGEKKRRMPTRIEFVREESSPEGLAETRKKLNLEVQKERIKAYIILDAKTMETGVAEWRAESVKADLIMRETIANMLSRAVTKERLKDRGVDPAVYEKARIRAELDPHEAKEIETPGTSKNAGFNLAVSGIFFFLIYISIFIYGAMIMRGVLEEKNNRIVEVIISSVRPSDLMLGKIIGIGLVGMTQYAVWGFVSAVLTAPAIVGMLGISEGLPPIPPLTIAAFVVFFLLGYFLYASLYAAFAAPFNTEQEAQQFVMIPGIMLILASTTWFFAFNQPNGTMAVALSFFPFTAPLLMFMRISVQPPPLWQVGLSIAILLLSIWGMAWIAGRIYRVGILMYGKKPTLPEIFRWVRQAD